MCACDRALKRWTSGSSEWESPPARSAAEPRTMLSGWGSTWPTYCWAKEPRRSWRWPGSSTTPDNPTRLRDRAPEVNGSLSAVSHSLVSSKTWIPFFLCSTFDVTWAILLGTRLCSVWCNAARLFRVTAVCHSWSWFWFQPVLPHSTSCNNLLSKHKMAFKHCHHHSASLAHG